MYEMKSNELTDNRMRLIPDSGSFRSAKTTTTDLLPQMADHTTPDGLPRSSRPIFFPIVEHGCVLPSAVQVAAFFTCPVKSFALQQVQCPEISSFGPAQHAPVFCPHQHRHVQVPGLPHQMFYDNREHGPVDRTQEKISFSTIDPGWLFESAQHVARRSTCPMGSVAMWQPETSVLANEMHFVDVSHLTQSMIFETQEPFNGLHMSNWHPLPGKPGSFIRLREVAEYGRGLAFFPWANHRRIEHPGKPEMVMDFQNEKYMQNIIITLEPGDALIWCPAKYIWPACVVCEKFLFPCDEHRCSMKHRRNISWWSSTLNTLQNLEATRRTHADGFLQKNWRGLANPF